MKRPSPAKSAACAFTGACVVSIFGPLAQVIALGDQGADPMNAAVIAFAIVLAVPIVAFSYLDRDPPGDDEQKRLERRERRIFAVGTVGSMLFLTFVMWW